ncbi:MAG: NAD(P)/FAD-dependent oxidoreductase, partial [Candidatus Bathyarchaeia archaeon]
MEALEVKLPSTCEVLVVGGGMMGLSIAYRIAQGGGDVTVLEQRNIASGSSGRNGGQIIQLDGRDKDPESIARRLVYARENNRILDDLPCELGCNFELNRC